jgi:hypothetical protein
VAKSALKQNGGPKGKVRFSPGAKEAAGRAAPPSSAKEEPSGQIYEEGPAPAAQAEKAASIEEIAVDGVAIAPAPVEATAWGDQSTSSES